MNQDSFEHALEGEWRGFPGGTASWWSLGGGGEAERGSPGGCKCHHNRSCPFSSRSCCRDVARGGKYGLGHLHPGADHLPAAGRSVHLSHQVGLQGLAWSRGQHRPRQPHSPERWEELGRRDAVLESSDSASPSRRCRYYSSLRLPLMYSHPYSQITVETEFDNPIYETGVSPAVPVLPRDIPEGLGWLGSHWMSPARPCGNNGMGGTGGREVRDARASLLCEQNNTQHLSCCLGMGRRS